MPAGMENPQPPIYSPARYLREIALAYAAEKNVQRSINTWKSSAQSKTTFFIEKFDLSMKQQFFMDTLKENFT